MLDTKKRQEVTYFIGYEVEHTVCHGARTLFVVGIQPANEIVDLATKTDCTHVYFGASQSFNPETWDDWDDWSSMITYVLEHNLWATLDFDVRHMDKMSAYPWNAHWRFIPMVSVKLPNIDKLNYNATLKLDDTTWGATNPGVWTHQLHDLKSKKNYTHWDQYKQDTILK